MELSGRVVVTLTVTDAPRSASWYKKVFNMEVIREFRSDASHQICLSHLASGTEICLLSHADGLSEPFTELRPGLDHLELIVSTRADLDTWSRHLDEVGVSHSGIKEPSYTRNAMLTFRDPDNIQLELFWRA